MENNQSTTGINFLKTNQFIITNNEKLCPKCSSKLDLEKQTIQHKLINIRFKCSTCGFICPIRHQLNQNTDTVTPLYDTSIFHFVQQFGVPLFERRQNLIRII